jgi:protein TonB
MIAKKNPKLNDEKNRTVYFQLGLFITSAATLMAFSWKAPKYASSNLKEEQIAAVPVEEIFIEKQEFPEVKPIAVKTEPIPVDPPDLQDIEPITDEKEKHKLIDVHKIIVDTGSGDGDDDGIPDFRNVLVDIPDVDAYLEGGISSFLVKHLVYPEISQYAGEEGTVYVSFIIERDGTPSAIQVMPGSVKSRELQAEALRVIRKMPKWKPAEHQGEKVRTKVKVPIKFKLEK